MKSMIHSLSTWSDDFEVSRRDRQDGTNTLRHGLRECVVDVPSNLQILKLRRICRLCAISTWLGLGLVFGLVLGLGGEKKVRVVKTPATGRQPKQILVHPRD